MIFPHTVALLKTCAFPCRDTQWSWLISLGLTTLG